jgi:hypothetical protein
VPVFHVAFTCRHPAAFLNPTFTKNVPGGPMIAMVQTTDRSETAVKEPIATIVETMLFNNKTILEKDRPMYGARPALIITDHDKSELNGLCYGLHRVRYCYDRSCHHE